jgi:hypothetical protein
METIAYNFHDENDTVFKNFKLTAGNYKIKIIFNYTNLTPFGVFWCLLVSADVRKR